MKLTATGRRELAKSLPGLVVCALMVLGGFVSLGLFNVPIHVQAVSQPLTPFTGTLCRTFSGATVQGAVTPDLGQITYCFSQNRVSWADNWTPQSNFTFNVPTISGQSLTVTTLQNSTTIDYHLTAAFAGRSLTGDLFLVQRGYNYKVTIKGTITGTAVQFALAIPFVGGSALSYDGNSPQVSRRHLGFNWRDVALPKTFNNGTKTLSITIGNSFSIDPVAEDGTASCEVSASSCNAALTTSNTNDVIVVWVAAESVCANSAPTSSPSITFTLRKNNGNLCEWYGTWASSGSITITCKQASSATLDCSFWGFSGVGAPIFDPDISIPCTSNGTGTQDGCTITTHYANEMLIWSSHLTGTYSNLFQDAGFVCNGVFIHTTFGIQSFFNDCDKPNPVVGALMKDTWTTSRGWDMIVDALMPVTDDVIVTATCSATTSQSNTISITVSSIQTQPITISTTSTNSITLSTIQTQTITQSSIQTQTITISRTSTMPTTQAKQTTTITTSFTLTTTSTNSITLSTTSTNSITQSSIQTQTITLSSTSTNSITQSTIYSLTQTLIQSCVNVLVATASTITNTQTTTVTNNIADPIGYLWLLLIPLFIVIALIASKRR